MKQKKRRREMFIFELILRKYEKKRKISMFTCEDYRSYEKVNEIR